MSISRIHSRKVADVANDICKVVSDYYVRKGKKMNERRYAILNRYFTGIDTASTSFRGQNYTIPVRLEFRQVITIPGPSALQTYEITTLIGLHKALKELVAECDKEAFWSTSGLANDLREKVLPRIMDHYQVAWEADMAYSEKLVREKEKLLESLEAPNLCQNPLIVPLAQAQRQHP